MRRADGPALLTLELLHAIAGIFGHYFSEVTEQSLSDHFVTAYQLLEEMGAAAPTTPSSKDDEKGSEDLPPPNAE